MRDCLRILLMLVVGVAVGCDCGIEPAAVPTQPAATDPATPVLQPCYGWYQTHGDEASQVVVTKLTIPGVFSEKVNEIRVARYMRVDADGVTQLPPQMYFGMTNAHGRNEKGGFGYGGAINVVDDEEHADAVLLEVSYYWTTKDQVQGELKERVSVKIGAPLDVKLPGDCRLHVSWRPVPGSRPESPAVGRPAGDLNETGINMNKKSDSPPSRFTAYDE